jgi:hypothetical protein
MPTAQPFIRIELAEKEIVRFREDLEDWKRRHQELAEDCWFWEDMAGKANYVFQQIARSAPYIQKLAEEQNDAVVREVYVRNRHVLKAWLEMAQRVRREMERLESEYGEVSGAESLREHVAEAERKLHTPRPVTIDETTGAILETDGTQFLFAGVTEQEVLNALEEERAGRMSSLKEIKAARAGQTV